MASRQPSVVTPLRTTPSTPTLRAAFTRTERSFLHDHHTERASPSLSPQPPRPRTKPSTPSPATPFHLCPQARITPLPFPLHPVSSSNHARSKSATSSPPTSPPSPAGVLPGSAAGIRATDGVSLSIRLLRERNRRGKGRGRNRTPISSRRIGMGDERGMRRRRDGWQKVGGMSGREPEGSIGMELGSRSR